MASSRVIVGMNERTMVIVCSSAVGAMFAVGSSLRLIAQVQCGVAPGVVVMVQARCSGY
jgi:ethanolamine transporter EutH